MAISQNRRETLKAMLEERRRELQTTLSTQKIEQRQREDRRGDNSNDVEDQIQDDIEFALMQMKAETVNKLSDALQRIEQDTYGLCFTCGGEIHEKRLRALPFAVRCKDCEEARELEEQRRRRLESHSAIATRGYNPDWD